MVVESVSTGAISTVFENPPGNVLNTRTFNPGQNLRIGAHVITSQYLPNPFASITFEVLGISSPIYVETRTNWLGDAWVDIVLPYETTKAYVRITAYFIGGSPAIETIPIAIGNVSPDPLPPTEEGDVFTPIKPFGDTLKWVVIGAGVIALVYIFSKAAPSVSRGYRSLRSA